MANENDWDDVYVSSSSSNNQSVATTNTTGNDVIFSTTTINQQGSSFGGNVVNNPYSSSSSNTNTYSTSIVNLLRNDEPISIDEYGAPSNNNLIGLHEPTLNDLVNGSDTSKTGLKTKIKNKLKRKQKKGGVRFQDEINNDFDSSDSSEERSDSGHNEKPKLALPLQKQDTNEKGFTEVILPPLPENRSINNLSTLPSMTAASTAPPQEETPTSNLMKGDTPHWLFILSFVVPTIIVCSILAAVQLGVCAYLFEQINSDPTFKNDPNALTWEHNCTLVDISNDCAERGKYLDRGTYCYFDVKFPSLNNLTNPIENPQVLELTTFLPYNMEETGIYYPMKVGDTVLCYTNKKEDLVNIIEPISTRYEAYYVAGGVLGVFGSISVVAAVCVIPTAFVRPKNRIY